MFYERYYRDWSRWKHPRKPRFIKYKGVTMEIIENMPQVEYRSKKGLSASDIKTLLENPHKFKIGFKKPQSDNLSLGSVVHSLILEKDNFSRDFLIMPELNLRTKEGKEVKEQLELQALNEKKTLIKNDIYTQALDIVESFQKTKVAKLFNNGLSEVSIFGEIDGRACKCRPDYYLKEKNIILDLKTTSIEGGASADGFTKIMANFKYYIQAAFYLQLTGAEEFYFVVLETSEPYMVGVYKLDIQALEFGLSEIKRAFKTYDDLEKYKDNVYLDFENDFKMVQEITLPNYIYYQKGVSY